MKYIRFILILSTITGIKSYAETVETKPASPSSPLRDPFWPVNYLSPTPIPSSVATTTASPNEQATQWPDLPLRGISKSADGSFFAVIEGAGVIRVGEVASILSGNLWFHWHISEIDSKGLRTIKLGTSRSRNDIPPLRKDLSTPENKP